MSTDKLVDSHSDMEEDSREVDSRNSESLDGVSSTMKNGRIGLLNIGNTCYMSTGIQVFSYFELSDNVVLISCSGVAQAFAE